LALFSGTSHQEYDEDVPQCAFCTLPENDHQNLVFYIKSNVCMPSQMTLPAMTLKFTNTLSVCCSPTLNAFKAGIFNSDVSFFRLLASVHDADPEEE
jgi:hypothetical protein